MSGANPARYCTLCYICQLVEMPLNPQTFAQAHLMQASIMAEQLQLCDTRLVLM